MNAAALAMLQAAANKKKQSFKDPVVKQVKVTREQYLAEKAEEEAKKNKKKAFLMGSNSSGGDDANGSGAGGSGPSSAEVQAILTQIQQERALLRKEKSEWMQQMQQLQAQVHGSLKNGSNGSNGTSSSSSIDTEALEERITEAVEEKITNLAKEVARLRYQVNQMEDKVDEALENGLGSGDRDDDDNVPATRSSSSSSNGVDAAAVEVAVEKATDAAVTAQLAQKAIKTLQTRLSALEKDTVPEMAAKLEKVATKVTVLQSKTFSMTPSSSNVHDTDSDDDDDTAERLQSLDKRLTQVEIKQLEMAVQAEKASQAQQRSRSKSRARTPTNATTRRADAEPSSASPVPSSPKAKAPASSKPAASTNTNTAVRTASPTKEAAPSTTVSSSNSTSLSDSNHHLEPHTADDISKAQGKDDKLIKYLENPGRGAHTLFPKFSMSVKNINGLRLVYFYKKVYIPDELRRKTLQYYHDEYPADWTKLVCKYAIWPSLDADITNFKA